MKKIVVIGILSIFLFAKDIVYIHAFGNYPCPSGKTPGKNSKEYLIPNNTKAKVIQWNKRYIQSGGVFATTDMWKESKLKILNGPLKGKILLVPHLYIFLKK